MMTLVHRFSENTHWKSDMADYIVFFSTLTRHRLLARNGACGEVCGFSSSSRASFSKAMNYPVSGAQPFGGAVGARHRIAAVWERIVAAS